MTRHIYLTMDQFNAAKELFEQGKTNGQIADAIGVPASEVFAAFGAAHNTAGRFHNHRQERYLEAMLEDEELRFREHLEETGIARFLDLVEANGGDGKPLLNMWEIARVMQTTTTKLYEMQAEAEAMVTKIKKQPKRRKYGKRERIS